jgi:hypothetical protein
MLRNNSTIHQPNLFGTDFLMQLDASDPLLKLADGIPWQEFDEAFSFTTQNRQALRVSRSVDDWVIDPEAVREFE